MVSLRKIPSTLPENGIITKNALWSTFISQGHFDYQTFQRKLKTKI